jgi:hypothetical protein
VAGLQVNGFYLNGSRSTCNGLHPVCMWVGVSKLLQIKCNGSPAAGRLKKSGVELYKNRSQLLLVSAAPHLKEKVIKQPRDFSRIAAPALVVVDF